MIYLGEVPWNVPATPQADTRDTRFQLKLNYTIELMLFKMAVQEGE